MLTDQIPDIIICEDEPYYCLVSGVFTQENSLLIHDGNHSIPGNGFLKVWSLRSRSLLNES